MKSCTQMMLSVIMDGIKDTDMMVDYVEAAKEHKNEEAYKWFKSKAKMRADSLRNDYEYVKAQTHLEEKVKSGDDIAIALHEYLQEATLDVINRVDMV